MREPAVRRWTRLRTEHRGNAPSADHATDRFGAAIAGRLLAIAGLALEMVRDAVLEDAETGERLWSATVRGADGQSVFGNGGDVVRMGVAVQAGRTYRLRATLCASSVAAHAQGELLALVLPAGAR